MMDTARAAEMSDPSCNPAFSRTWTPPPKRKRPALGRTSNGADFFDNNSDAADTTVRRALQAASRRIASIEHRAQLLAQLGQRDAALRLAGVAAGIREAIR